MEAQAQRHRAFPSHPNSPPATPGSQSQPRFPSAASHTTPTKKRMGFAMFAQQSPPLEHIEPTGKDHQFHYTRPQSQDLSSRPSSASGFAQASSVELSEVDLDDSNLVAKQPKTRRVVEGHFAVEEVADNASGYGSNIEIVQPDTTDEAGSDRGSDGKADSITEDLQNMRCEDEDDDESEQETRRINRKNRKKRWSWRSHKRSHSQSVGSDSDTDDAEALDAHDVGSSARRLRRRVRGPGGPGDRSSLNLDDMPNLDIPELDEPDEDGTFPNRPPSLPSDEENLFKDALPFWPDQMMIDPDDSSSDSSS